MITEKEAAQKICPHLPVDTETEQADHGTVTRVRAFAMCWGSKCAMWRWWMEPIYVNSGAHIKAHVKSDKGYCGLADRPEMPSR